ncbi:energy transducer TonB [Tenacibaculum sp. AHE15PA]|uniref:M56 family metallopeptidase n=1 Tax=unclassified Tenacibaculum TaxID=2635139 RepID=UPI001C4E8E03|nr:MULTISPECIES: M56 family metallopeptidase [unclassified Tenacibaculum]QXP73543.1 energy transducer TonB [Tenacibaculum sp. AHE14PA]QXP75057.1 energy transducer TonB [Tenacibaculum sp. AHE15PA]
MINYIIQVILFQTLFVAVYDFFLSKETFFTKNRWYLLSTSVISFLLPLFKIPTIQKVVQLEYTILLPEVVLSPQSVLEKAAWYQSINYLDVLFIAGSLLFLTIFIIKLQRIVRLIFKYGSENRQAYKLVLLPKNAKAFSFFNYIFLGKGIPAAKQEKIIEHELVHSLQKHTFDLLFFEFLRIFMWFNPMVYVYQNRISLVHEYISDDVVTKSTEKENYINNLLSDIFQVENISFVNQFYKHSLIKKRVIMMTKGKSKQVKQLKYLLLIPLLASMVLYASCSSTKKVTKKVEIIEVVEVEDVPFSILDKYPTFPGCEEGDKVCFNKSMAKFTAENFKIKNKDSLGLVPGKKRIYVQFKIDTDGSIVSVNAHAPHPKLKEQAIEMLKKLPKMKPGEKAGKKVRTGYTLPITFEIK